MIFYVKMKSYKKNHGRRSGNLSKSLLKLMTFNFISANSNSRGNVPLSTLRLTPMQKKETGNRTEKTAKQL